MNILLIFAATIVAVALGCSDMNERIARVNECREATRDESKTNPCGALKKLEACSRRSAEGCPLLMEQVEQGIAALRRQMGSMCGGNGPITGKGCSDVARKMGRISACKEAFAVDVRTNPCGAIDKFNGCVRGYGEGCKYLEAHIEKAIVAMRAQIPTGTCNGNGPTPDGSCSFTETRTRGVRECQRSFSMGEEARTNPCSALDKFEVCVHGVLEGCPALVAEMDPVIASMRGQLPDGMCDGTGPTTDGSSIPDTDNVPPEVTTLPPGDGGQCDASRALRKLKVCQSFMARVQEKGQRDFCRRFPKIVRCMNKAIRGCDDLTDAVEPLLTAARGVFKTICASPTRGS